MKSYSHSRFHSGAFLALVLLNLTLLVYVGLGRKSGAIGPPLDRLPGSHAPSQLGKFLQEELHLTDEQVKAFAVMKKEHHHRAQRIRRQLRRDRQWLFNSLDKDPAVIDSMTQKIAHAHKALETYTYQHFAELWALCTPQQQKGLEGMLDDLMRRLAPPGPGRGPHNGPPPFRDGRPPRDGMPPRDRMPPSGEGSPAH